MFSLVINHPIVDGKKELVMLELAAGKMRSFVLGYNLLPLYPAFCRKPKNERYEIMNQSGSNKHENEWFDCYGHSSCFSPDVVRDGCHPRIMKHREPCDKAIVLVHGLADSPYFS